MKSHLKNIIKLNGALSLSEFMNEALFNPKFGYYKQKNPFGKKGDFVTSPEISQVFGELIGAYLIGIWQNNYSEKKINLVEMGAGRGTLMKDLLCLAKKVPKFKENFNISIIEISPKLQDIQKENLKDFNVSWYENFTDFYAKNNSDPIFFVSNELFDCFAINQLVKTNNGWMEKAVGIKDENLKFVLLPSAIKPKKDGEIDDVFEFSLSASKFMDELSRAIKATSGLGLIIDYGYLKSSKNTLQALKNHQYVDPLKEAGDCDITALVNFSDLKEIAVRNDLQTSLISQKEFLTSVGIELRREKLLSKNSHSKQQKINSAIDRLIDKKQMGELFKVLIMWK